MSDWMPWMAPWSGRGLALLLGVLGAWVIWRGLFRDRSGEGLRCPKCWYDLRGLPSWTCPECGHTTKTDRERHRTRRHWRMAALGLVVMFALPSCVVYRRVREFGWEYYLTYGPGYWLAPRRVQETWEFAGGYRVSLEQDRRDPNSGMTLFIKKGRATQFVVSDHSSGVGDPERPGKVEDLNGDGIADLIITGHSGGAHCCKTFYMFALDPRGLRLLVKINAEHSGVEVKDVDGDGIAELVADDWTFAYWRACFGASPAPRVVFAWRGGRYRPAPELMRGPALEAGALGKLAAEVRSGIATNRGSVEDQSQLWGTMLDLIYRGQSGQAYRFLDEVWPQQTADKEEFLQDFQRQLGSSPYRAVIEALGHPALPERQQSCCGGGE